MLKHQVSLPEVRVHKKELKERIQQLSENDPARVVILNEPGLTQWMGSLHPNGSLYEKPVMIDAAKREHNGFKTFLQENGCTVYNVKEILLKDCDKDVVARVKLEDLAFSTIQYLLDPRQDPSELTEKDKFLLSDQYKRDCIGKMDNSQLVDIVLSTPTIYLTKALKNTELLVTNYSFLPLVNLVFTRDQQITTVKGIVMGNPTSPIRRGEVRVMKFCFEKLGFPIVGEVMPPGTLEGGDFYPWSDDLAMIGIGPRTNIHSVRYMMDNQLFGTRRVAVVKDYFDQDQQRMHLDTIMNILAPNIVMMEETLIGGSALKRRLVDEYVLDGDRYVLSRVHDIELSQYLKEYVNSPESGLTVSILPVSTEMQFRYGCNGLNLGGGHMALVDEETAKYLARSGYTGKISLVQFRHMMDMFGSIHCCSQVVSRVPLNLSRFPSQSTEKAHGPVQRRVVPRETKARQSSAVGVMLAPNSFVVPSESDNPFLSAAVSVGSEMSKHSGPREYRARIVEEFSKLHRLLTTEIGMEIYLFTHEEYHETPEATFLRDWFSTHPASETHDGRGKFVMYPLCHPHRQGEKREDIIQLIGKDLYDDCVDLEVSIGKPSDGTRFQSGDLILDRLHNLVYLATSPKTNLLLLKAFTDQVNFKPVTFQIKEEYSNFSTSALLSIGTKYVIVCFEAFQSETVVDELRTQWKNQGRNLIEITIEQMKRFCAQVQEVQKPNGAYVIVGSQTALNAFTEAQTQLLRDSVENIHRVDISLIETLTGRGVIALLTQLF